MNTVSNERGRERVRSQLINVSNERGLKWLWSQMNWSQQSWNQERFPNYHCCWSRHIYYITIDVCS